MKYIILCVFSLSCISQSFADEETYTKKEKKNQYSYKEASVLSMMGWGIGLFAAIAVLCSLVENNPAHSNTQTTTQ